MPEEEQTQIVALRIPRSTYAVLLAKSGDWQMSVSCLIRELIIKVFNESEDEMKKIKSYRKRPGK